MNDPAEMARRSEDGAMTQFDPTRIAKEVASSEALEKWARRVKDHDALYAAIEHKARWQRDFVVWWDQQEKHPGGRPTDKPVAVLRRVIDYGLTRDIVHRWRERFLVAGDLEDTSKFERWLEDAQARCLKVVEAQQAANYSSESNEWYTPARYIDAVRELFGGDIDLDPATSVSANETVRASQIFTIKDDALSQDWHGRVFLNPPYGVESGDSVAGMFCKKAIHEYGKGNVEACVILVNSLHSQKWQRPLYDFPVCLVDHRIQFVSGDGTTNKNPTFQNLFVYLGPDSSRFARVFSTFGYCMQRAG